MTFHYPWRKAFSTCTYLIAPVKREKEIKAQLLRPSFYQGNPGFGPISYILFSDLRCVCDAKCKFRGNMEVLNNIAKVTYR